MTKLLDPRVGAASLGARAAYTALRKARDEHDTIHSASTRGVVDTVAGILLTREWDAKALLEELAALRLVAVTDDKVVLLPRTSRAKREDGTPRVAKTDAERSATYRRNKKAGKRDESRDESRDDRDVTGVTNPVTPTVTDEGNTGKEAVKQRDAAVTNPVTGRDADRDGGSSPLPQVSSPSSPSPTPSSSSSPSSFPETPSTPPSTAGARETQPSGQPGLPGVEGGTETAKPDEAPKAKPKRPAKPKPEPAPDPVPDEGTAARRVYDLVRADAGLVAIVRGPGAWSQRITIDGAFPGLSAEQVIAGVLAAARWNAANPGRWKTELGVEAWLNKNSRDAMATPRPAAPSPTPRVSGRVPVPRDPVPRDPEERRAAFVRAMSRYEAQ